mmetsp:Transcript_64685/g.140913  ORF Transcript_64685/g.140913 Transcript_64685/m.140913 type:complete len:231 (-) Transcript_64685:510-1202(-)
MTMILALGHVDAAAALQVWRTLLLASLHLNPLPVNLMAPVGQHSLNSAWVRETDVPKAPATLRAPIEHNLGICEDPKLREVRMEHRVVAGLRQTAHKNPARSKLRRRGWSKLARALSRRPQGILQDLQCCRRRCGRSWRPRECWRRRPSWPLIFAHPDGHNLPIENVIHRVSRLARGSSRQHGGGLLCSAERAEAKAPGPASVAVHHDNAVSLAKHSEVGIHRLRSGCRS